MIFGCIVSSLALHSSKNLVDLIRCLTVGQHVRLFSKHNPQKVILIIGCVNFQLAAAAAISFSGKNATHCCHIGMALGSVMVRHRARQKAIQIEMRRLRESRKSLN